MTGSEASSISRRAALAGMSVGAAGLAFGWDWLTVAPANAAPIWYSPFTTRGAVFAGGGEYLAVRSNGTVHQGVDFNNAIHPAGTVVRSCAAGQVVAVTGVDPVYGTKVTIQHSDGFLTLYGHMAGGSVPAKIVPGAVISASTPIGKVGGTPLKADGTNSLPPHLHLGLFQNGTRLDPTFLVSATLAGNTPVPPANLFIQRTDNTMYLRYTSAVPNLWIALDIVHKQYRLLPAGGFESELLTSMVNTGELVQHNIADPVWGQTFGNGQFTQIAS